MGMALSLAIIPTALTNQALALISSVDVGSENPKGKSAPGQQPTTKGKGQTQFTENQNPAGAAPPGQNKIIIDTGDDDDDNNGGDDDVGNGDGDSGGEPIPCPTC